MRRRSNGIALQTSSRRRETMPTILLVLAFHVTISLAMRAVPEYYDDRNNELIFRRKVDNALATVRSLLESAKSPRRILSASEVEHGYDDKFSLAEFVTNTAVASVANALDRLGLGMDVLLAGDGGGRVQLRFAANETCTFVEKTVVEVTDPSTTARHETYETTATGDPKKVEEKKTTTRAIREVTEYRWRFELSHGLQLVQFGPGSNAIESIRAIQSRTAGQDIVVTGSERAPCQSQYSPPALEVDLGWFLSQLNGGGGREEALQSQFRIDRDASSCKSPRRNDNVEEAVKWFGELREWGWSVSTYFQNTIPSRIFNRYRHTKQDGAQGDEATNLLQSIDDSAIFVPVLPLFQEDSTNSSGSDGVALAGSDADLLLGEQLRTMDEALSLYGQKFPSTDEAGIASTVESKLILLSKHLLSVATSFEEGVSYVERMLRSQLVSAVGREISEGDFDEFVRAFYPKLFKSEYIPEPFVYAVRRPDHYPDGTLAMEAMPTGKDSFDPILTSTRKVESPALMNMPLNAATSVQLGGAQYLHAWIRTEFGGAMGGVRARLVARARQFSSFLLCVGNIAGPDTFQPKHAIILQNKDEVLIPLLLEPLPTPKEFRDAVQSLSPEQQEFAKAFRTMQLESSVFAVAVVQLKPQLEEVLSLPPDSLTKEIKLTQNLLEMFIEYQIPPDLLSYDGDMTVSTDEKLSRVKENVASVQTMIDEAKEREVKEAERRADMKATEEKRWKAQHMNMAFDAMEDDVMVEAAMMADEMPEMMAMDAMPKMKMAHARSIPRQMRPTASPSSMDGAAEHRLRATVTGHESGTDAAHIEEEGDVDKTDTLGNAVDYSSVAKKLDAAFDEFDIESALRPTKILIQDAALWEKNFHKTLLTPREKAFVSEEDKRREKEKAFDLLDALSKSGARPIHSSELHVIVAATHRFDNSLIDTVIQSNENPITSVERSALIVSSTVHDVPVADLVLGQGRLSSIEQHSPGLLDMGKRQAASEDEGAAKATE